MGDENLWREMAVQIIKKNGDVNHVSAIWLDIWMADIFPASNIYIEMVINFVKLKLYGNWVQ